MANPILNDKMLESSRAGWAAPTPPSPGGQTWAPPTPGTQVVDDGPVSPWQGAMTVSGTITKSTILFVLLLASATAGWLATGEETARDRFGNEVVVATFPAIAMLGIVIGLAAAFGTYFKPHLAKFFGPAYALGFGFAVGAIIVVILFAQRGIVGAISKGYETFQSGIVLQAAGATAAVFGVMLALYRTRVIKVTDRFRRVVVMATLGIMVFYGVSLIMRLFGAEVPFLHEASALGIGLSVFICVIAAMNLALDFDFIEKGARSGLAKDFEWFAAFGLLVTIVWLYLELLRLLAKLQQR